MDLINVPRTSYLFEKYGKNLDVKLCREEGLINSLFRTFIPILDQLTNLHSIATSVAYLACDRDSPNITNENFTNGTIGSQWYH